MTDAEAEELLLQLSAHYRRPVLPLNRFCDAMSSWFRAIEMNTQRNGQGSAVHGSRYSAFLRLIERDIHKSGLLHRLLFRGESLRTEMCPLHQGAMDTALWVGHPDKEPCKHGCGGTGWLPERPLS